MIVFFVGKEERWQDRRESRLRDPLDSATNN
jgi:hypothetical protein